MKDDEKQFLIELYKANLNSRVYPLELYKSNKFQYIAYKRLLYILEKWSDKGWFEYGIGPMVGWLMDKGIIKVKELIKKE